MPIPSNTVETDRQSVLMSSILERTSHDEEHSGSRFVRCLPKADPIISAQSLGQAAQAVALAISQLLGTISAARSERAAPRTPSPPKDASHEDDSDDKEVLEELASEEMPQPAVLLDGPAR